MTKLQDIFPEAEAMIQRASLDRLIAEAAALAGGKHRCDVIGHRWVMIGGASAGCCHDCVCSVSVHECSVCGECDYGDHDHRDVIANCERNT